MPDLPISKIVVGERRREDAGDIDGLAASIKRYGLLHPIVVDEANNLVAGGRRLEACKRLKWLGVPVTLLGDLTDAERREIELEENLRRKDLTPAEETRIMVRLIEVTRGVLQNQEPEAQGFPSDDFSQEQDEGGFAQVGQNLGGRPPKRGVSLQAIAERNGISRTNLQRAEIHGEALDEYPFMAAPEWKQDHAIAARKQFNRLPETDRPLAAKLIDQDYVPPRDAVAMLANLAEMPEPERARVFDLNESPDLRDQNLAVTIAAQKPPMPDARLTNLNLAAEQLRIAARMFPDDPFTPRIAALVESTRAVSVEIKEHPRG